MIQQYLQKLGFTEKEQKLYLTLAEIGSQPASVVAQKCKYDRVTAYKNLKKLAEKGFIKIYYDQGIQYFGVQSFEHINSYLTEQIDAFTELSEEFPLVEKMLRSFQKGQNFIPKLEIFENETGIKRLFRDLLFSAKEQQIGQIRMLTSNTFDERLGDIPLSKYVEEFFQEIAERKINLEVFEATGMLIPERIHQVPMAQFSPEKMPAARGTTNIFLAGHAVYIACYQTSQIGLKIQQSEISQIFHFLFDLMKRMGDG
jgi:sugar-specific transcriptional regulator TrmB